MAEGPHIFASAFGHVGPECFRNQAFDVAEGTSARHAIHRIVYRYSQYFEASNYVGLRGHIGPEFRSRPSDVAEGRYTKQHISNYVGLRPHRTRPKADAI